MSGVLCYILIPSYLPSTILSAWCVRSAWRSEGTGRSGRSAVGRWDQRTSPPSQKAISIPAHATRAWYSTHYLWYAQQATYTVCIYRCVQVNPVDPYLAYLREYSWPVLRPTPDLWTCWVSPRYILSVSGELCGPWPVVTGDNMPPFGIQD